MCDWKTRNRRENGTEEIFEVIIVERFPKLMTANKPQIQEAQRTPNRTNIKLNQTYAAISYSNGRKLKTKEKY